jgi:hypothetical protein
MTKTMDYRTKVIVLTALFAVLSLTAVLGWTFSQQATAQRQAQEALIPGYDASAITGLELSNGVALKKDASWALTFQGHPFPASTDRIETYLKTLSTLQRERLVTTGDAKPFGLDQGYKTLKLLGAGGKVVADLQVGGANDLGDKVYVRLAGQKEIWQTDRGFARTLDLDFNTWADLTLFPGRKAADLTRITFDSRIETSDKTVYTPFDLERVVGGKSKWQNRVTKASTDTMASWADLVATVHFGAFVSPSDPPAAASSVGTVTYTWADGTSTAIKLSAADAQNRYRATDGKREFWINDWALGQILYK